MVKSSLLSISSVILVSIFTKLPALTLSGSALDNCSAVILVMLGAALMKNSIFFVAVRDFDCATNVKVTMSDSLGNLY